MTNDIYSKINITHIIQTIEGIPESAGP